MISGSSEDELELSGMRTFAIESVQDFLNQVGHETMYASSGNKHFFIKSCHRQTYQNYEQSRQKLGTILENKVPPNLKLTKHDINKSCSSI